MSGFPMLNGIRRMVSGNRKRLVVEDFDLDLSYIENRIIASAYPSSGLEGLYRNASDEVKRFLEARHSKHYRIYNLRSEKRYANDFFDNAAEYTFEDHHAPMLRTVIDFCQDASDYLAQDPLNVVVVHCKAGKGRTGTMISALLLKLRIANDPIEAMQMYGDRRTHDGHGVTIPSQRRYVFYYDSFVRNPWTVADREIQIKKLILMGEQDVIGQDDTCMISVKILPSTEKLWFTISPKIVNEKLIELDLDHELVVKNDFTTALWRTTQIGYKIKVLSFSLHTHFVPKNLVLEKNELDTAADSKRKNALGSSFKIKLCSMER